MIDPLKKIAEGIKNASNAEKSRKSVSWFVKKINSLSAGMTREALREAQGRQRERTFIGEMVFFAYDAKGKDTLPFFDRFPLVVVIEPYSDGFLGLNLHYLGLGERRVLLDALSRYATPGKGRNRDQRMRVSYEIVKAFSQSSIARLCVKRYLADHVRSQFIFVESSEWEIAIHLPVEQWHYNKSKKP